MRVLRTALLVTALALGPATPAQAQVVAGHSCEEIRGYVVQYGRVRAIAWALAHGYTWANIREALRVCSYKTRRTR